MYEEEGEEISGRSGWDTLVSTWFLWLPIIAYIILKGRLGIVTMDKAFAACGMIALAGILMRSADWGFKNATPKLIWNPGFSTTGGEFATVGNFAILTPGIKAWAWYMNFKSPVWVVPIDSITKVGRSIVLNCDLQLVGIDEIPPDVRGFIYENEMKPPFYLGYASPEQMMQTVADEEAVSGMKSPSVSRLIIQLKEQTKMVNMLLDILKGKFGAVEDFTAAMSRIRIRGEEKTIDKIKSALIEKEMV